jgi:hypothetical protein
MVTDPHPHPTPNHPVVPIIPPINSRRASRANLPNVLEQWLSLRGRNGRLLGWIRLYRPLRTRKWAMVMCSIDGRRKMRGRGGEIGIEEEIEVGSAMDLKGVGGGNYVFGNLPCLRKVRIWVRVWILTLIDASSSHLSQTFCPCGTLRRQMV